MSLSLPWPDVRKQTPGGQALDTDGVQQNFEKVALEWPNNLYAPAGTVTALPAAGQDGQIVRYLADDTNGVVWTFRYRSASTSSYKWEFVGGSPLTILVTTAETTTSVFSTYATLSTDVAVTVPLAGDYVASGSCGASNSGAGYCYMGIAVNTAAPDYSYCRISGAGEYDSVAITDVRLSALAASDVVRQRYAVDAGTGTFERRRLSVLPVRVS